MAGNSNPKLVQDIARILKISVTDAGKEMFSSEMDRLLGLSCNRVGREGLRGGWGRLMVRLLFYFCTGKM